MTYLWTLINHALNLGIRCGLVVEILWPTIGNLSHHVIYLHNNLYMNIPWLIFHNIFFLFRRYPVYDYETGLRLIYAKLPLDLTCKQCIIQFTYVAGKLNLDISSLSKLLLNYNTVFVRLKSVYDDHFISLKGTIGANVLMGQEQLDAGPRKHSVAVLTLK